MSKASTHMNAERAPVLNSRSGNRSSSRKPAAGLSQESFSEFSQVITHRIGSLLSGIEGYTDLVLTSLHKTEDRQNAFRILESVARINGVLADLRHYQESLTLSKHLVDAKLIGTEVIQLISDSEAARLRVESALQEGILIDADDRLIRQAILSILRNAFESTQTDKLAVSLTTDSVDEGQTIRFKIYSPVPIQDESLRAKIFNPFFTTKAANLGLGLTMARRIFRAHGGDVVLSSSELEVGTEFTCTIPQATPGA